MARYHSELSRVQIPAVIHLERLGYTYLPHVPEFDHRTNILTGIFSESLKRLNPSISDTEIKRELDLIVNVLKNDDLGREFYGKLTAKTGVRYIDFDNPKNNVWHTATEFTCENKDTTDQFRPDITCFINGLPIAFIEVKIPNNHDGILAERKRMNERMQNVKFRRFLNITQLMIFSNNQEYDNESRVPIQGAFYASITNKNIFFNVFREQSNTFYEQLHLEQISLEREEQIVNSFHIPQLRALQAYEMNKRPTTPTNRVLSSLLSKERILFLLRYGFAYVDTTQENAKGEKIKTLEKHVMRYQQLFASLAIRRKLNQGVRSGVIWHTQGSGKTALAYYSVKSLTDYFSNINHASKFYFIVDRLNLMEQAADEFAARGLVVRTANSREELMEDFRETAAVDNSSGAPEIMVVNIQKFKEDHTKVVIPPSYGINLQRVFFIDEAHRGYNPAGSFLANLMDADPKAIKIALTGTPLLAEERASWKVFGEYIDKYYYDKSIADGYTLRLMREDIQTSYKEQLLALLEEKAKQVDVKKSDIDKQQIIESEKYLRKLIEYVTSDFRDFRIMTGHKTVGGMIVCETNEQAQKLFDLFKEHEAAETKHAPLKAELILHNVYDKGERDAITKRYKRTTELDFLIVNQMLLTGFDAHRLKRLYLTRKMKDHELLQALTRVNRPYLDFKYGYVVDFAGIKENFEETNNRYLKELNRCYSDDPDEPSNDIPSIGLAILESKEEIIAKLKDIKEILFAFTCDNPEAFCEELEGIEDKQVLYNLRHELEEAKALSNQIRTYGDDELRQIASKLKVGDLPVLISEVNHRIDRVNQTEQLQHSEEVQGAINLILSQIEYEFSKVMTEEMEIVNNDLKEQYQKVTREFELNFDQQEEQFVDLLKTFREYFRKKGFIPQDVADARERIHYMDEVMKRIKKINADNERLKRAYKNDERFARIHKRIREENEERMTYGKKPVIAKGESEIAEGLNQVREWINKKIFYNYQIMENEEVFKQEILWKLSDELLTMNVEANVADRIFIRNHIANEYIAQFNNLKIS